MRPNNTEISNFAIKKLRIPEYDFAELQLVVLRNGPSMDDGDAANI